MDKKLFEIGDRYEGGKISGKFKKAWIEESFDFEAKTGKQVGLPGTGAYLGTGMSKKRILVLLFLFFLGFAVILGRVFDLQIIKGGHYRALAEGNRIRLLPIPSERGIIYDREGEELVQNVPNFSLTVVPQDLPREKEKRDEILNKVVAISGVNKDDLTRLLDKYRSYSYASLVIKENLDYNSALKLYLESAELPGINIEKGSKRFYKTGKDQNATSTLSLSHILGYLGKLDENQTNSLKDKGYLPFDNIGKIGIEKTYESELRGVYGLKKVEVDAFGRERNVLAENPPVPGKNIILTIDLEAQRKMESLIANALKKLKTKRAAGIAIDPRDGSVLALVSWPAFDNNLFSDGISQADYLKYTEDKDRPLFNRAISGSYPSGSTVKPVIAAAAIQEKIITPKTTILSVGGIQVGDWFFRDWKAGGHGVTNVTKALAWSINTFFYYIGGGYKDFKGLGIEKLVEYFYRFGLGRTTGIDLPSEAEGFVSTPEWKLREKNEKWYVGDTYNLSIGQGDLLVTPIQVAVWTSAIANGGNLVQPHLLSVISDPFLKEIKPAYPTQPTGVLPENIFTARQGMKDCVAYGSCGLLKSLKFSSGGKTGTAQWSAKGENHAWFTSFAPADNPQIVVTVLVEEGVEGSTVAEPIARDFLQWWGRKYLK